MLCKRSSKATLYYVPTRSSFPPEDHGDLPSPLSPGFVRL